MLRTLVSCNTCRDNTLTTIYEELTLGHLCISLNKWPMITVAVHPVFVYCYVCVSVSRKLLYGKPTACNGEVESGFTRFSVETMLQVVQCLLLLS